MYCFGEGCGYGRGMGRIAGKIGVLHYLVYAITAGFELIEGEFIVGDPEDNECRADPDRQSEHVNQGAWVCGEDCPLLG